MQIKLCATRAHGWPTDNAQDAYPATIPRELWDDLVMGFMGCTPDQEQSPYAIYTGRPHNMPVYASDAVIRRGL